MMIEYRLNGIASPVELTPTSVVTVVIAENGGYDICLNGTAKYHTGDRARACEYAYQLGKERDALLKNQERVGEVIYKNEPKPPAPPPPDRPDSSAVTIHACGLTRITPK